MAQSDGQTLLEVVNLNTAFAKHHVVKDFSLRIAKGETIAIIGETGSGKTVALTSLLGILDSDKVTVSMDKVVFMDDKTLTDKKGKEIAMVFQSARLSLNPVKKCGIQIQRVIRKHLHINRKDAKSKTLELLKSVEISDAERIFNAFPHEVSGGELQRVMIAMGLSCDPKVLILDEPAASLDKIIQHSIIQLLKKVRDRGLAIILISHDLEMVSDIADHIIHIDNGQIIASQSTENFFLHPNHELSKQLVKRLSQFRSGTYPQIEMKDAVLLVQGLMKSFKGGNIAFKDLTFTLHAGEILGVIGESGSGKSSLGKCLSGIWPYDSGTLKSEVPMDKICYVYQDAYSAMDPELSVSAIIQEVLRLKPSNRQATDLLKDVLLDDDVLPKKIHELSGGQRQRVNLARALATDPEILICDEITSGLDLSVQIEIIELIAMSMKNLAIIFISHDISLVKYFCHRVLIMKEGNLVQMGKNQDIFEELKSGYTFDLINSVPKVKYFLNT